LVNIEIIIGIIGVVVLLAVFAPITFDVGGGGGTVNLTAEQAGNLTQFDNFEWGSAKDFVAKSTSSPRAFVEVFTEYKVDVLEFADSGQLSSAVWTSALPDQFNATSAEPRIDIYWYKDTDGNDGGVCWVITGKSISLLDTLDATFNVTKDICRETTASPVEVDLLLIDSLFFDAGELIPSSDRSYVVISLGRNTTNALDTLNQDALFLGARIIWDRSPEI